MSTNVAVLDALTAEALAAFRQSLGARFTVAGTASSDAVPEAEYVISRNHAVGAALLAAYPALRAAIVLDSGSATIDEAACRHARVAVFVVPSPTLISVAEHTVLLILALVKRFVPAIEALRAGVVAGDIQPALTTQQSYAYNWVGLSGFDALYGKRVGLVGIGKIGRAVAARLYAFGVEVLYTKRTRLSADEEAQLGARFTSFDELLAGVDCVSLHHRFDPTTDRCMAAAQFAAMPRGSYFINTARGRLVDEQALIDALERGHLAGAALDVFQYEPLPPDSPLLRAPNLILTPHVGGIPSHASLLTELGEAARLIRSHHDA